MSGKGTSIKLRHQGFEKVNKNLIHFKLRLCSFIQNSRMKFLKWLGIILLLLIVLYFAGPRPSTPVFTKELPVVPSQYAALEKYIHDGEARHKLKPNNEARIW